MRTPSPVFANVAFLRIPGFEGRPVVEQASLKERLEAPPSARLFSLLPMLVEASWGIGKS